MKAERDKVICRAVGHRFDLLTGKCKRCDAVNPSLKADDISRRSTTDEPTGGEDES